jgi:hypothetical protein
MAGEGMENKKNKIAVFETKITTYPNQYSDKFKKGMFKECIKVDSLTGVYRKWESTLYTMESMPTAHIFE